MRKAMLFLALMIQAPLAAFAEGACPNTCPDGYVRSVDTGKCVPIAPMV
jgi:hypothetical protein